ncbi:gpW family head-tail joining protein [Glaciecola siphonariae]|uniref:GpW family head-tail joining protein n=1 Tax=Glaciecola siphonariae TaxID=521012 RepID=A0ABV9LSC4_9ALTE
MAVNQSAQLDEAISARHKLLTGGTVAKVTKDGTTVEYTRASLPELSRYIESLSQSVNGRSNRRAPAGVRF